jgi:hypothetical protein
VADGEWQVLRLPTTPDPTTHIKIAARWPVSQAEWDRMILLLETMEPGLVSDDEDEVRPA